MGAMQRTKGATGERTVINMFKEHGFDDVKRNLMQTAEGGFDLVGKSVELFAIEVKKHKKLNINSAWKQTTAQATHDLIPVLIYHIPHTSRWLVQMPLSAVNPTLSKERTVTMDFEDFIYVAREIVL
jgi:Holliday junction resolvase-like predicted endonuclease